MATIKLPESMRNRIAAAVTAGYPHETCGLLIGRQGAGAVEVLDSVQAANLDQERPGDRYELDPKAMLAEDRDARSRGLEIVGVWHSHPDHPAAPSETDRAAAWEGWSYLIVSVARDGINAIRSWRLDAGQFYEEDVAL
ncbi:MAG: M67 family metallopeptidase [Gammaproteobacteria bacterium]|nr:M67 family metallopeptidase [Gammaproteobacteria bacterium]